MTDAPFGQAAEIETTDVDVATDALRHFYVAADLDPVGDTAVMMQMKALQLPMVTVGSVGFGVDIEIRAEDVTAYYIDAPLSGSAMNRWRDGESLHTTAGAVAVFTPGTPCQLDWSADCDQLCVKVDESQMRSQLEAMLNRTVYQRITFDRHFDLESAAARDWYYLVRLLGRQAWQPGGLLNHPLAVGNLQLLLIQGLLQMQHHNFADALSARDSPAGAAVTKRAIDLMNADPQKPWTTAQLASATGVSARALQRAFDRSGHPSPMAYLRRLRLERVHAELLSHSPDSATVTTVATRWGFLHLGRFAGQYRQQYGQSPSHTLRLGGRPHRPSLAPGAGAVEPTPG
ncbi:AraC family transcriptional regulator [Mycobacterium yunnanensis]|uniref:AraC family transcriptional regulator n=1 Tax=Mycobacterium yunnanensis TaxID=368477 RepID=A0A9X2YJS5_9MYCO|nr:AraC family transcriptional regulator [Mycobacterium yunnanensis]MCV7420582.1 AraC family transcriptional regulator [Mycobacterium yunnanensis]